MGTSTVSEPFRRQSTLGFRSKADFVRPRPTVTGPRSRGIGFFPTGSHRRRDIPRSYPIFAALGTALNNQPPHLHEPQSKNPVVSSQQPVDRGACGSRLKVQGKKSFLPCAMYLAPCAFYQSPIRNSQFEIRNSKSSILPLLFIRLMLKLTLA